MNYALIGCGVLVAALLFVWVLSIIYRNRKDEAVNNWLYHILYAVDSGCDDLELPGKKRQAVQAVMDVLGWRRVVVPPVLVDWGLSMLVWLVRKTGVPDLHKEEVKSDENNA